MKNNSPLISVIMPVYNAGRYLKQAIRSILNQSYSNFEFIIINDASTDNSLRIINSFKDRRINIINLHKNVGVAKALNIGLNISQGKYIARMDADDVSLPERLNILRNYLDTHPKTGIVGSWAVEIDQTGKTVSAVNTLTSDAQIKRQMIYHNPLIHPTVMFRSGLTYTYGNYDEKLNGAEDWDLWLRWGRYTQISNLPQVLLKYRRYHESVSAKRIKYIEIANIKLIIKAITKYKYSKKYIWYAVKTIVSFLIPEKEKKTMINLFSQIDSIFVKPFVFILKKTEYLSALSLHLVKLTGKHQDAIHPKHLISIRQPFYLTDIKPRDFILDIGCHNGQRTIKAAGKCKSIIGIDKDKQALLLAENEAKRRNIRNVFFNECNIEKKLPFKNNIFDKVMFLDVLEHLNKRKQVLKEIYRVLKTHGKLFLSVPNSGSSWKRIQKKYGLNYFSDPDHKIEFSEPEIIDLLNRNRFKLISIQPVTLDTPFIGFFDVIGGLSLKLYSIISEKRHQAVIKNPSESVGWEIICKKYI